MSRKRLSGWGRAFLMKAGGSEQVHSVRQSDGAERTGKGGSLLSRALAQDFGFYPKSHKKSSEGFKQGVA